MGHTNPTRTPHGREREGRMKNNISEKVKTNERTKDGESNETRPGKRVNEK